ncbi:hypothetical protein HD806DRAFT_274364 [Xylariaceae sp. AK1471]|nr:hypothetical protein HD806DRAFT_274364 [Xylariaceae sp. AK1471]
MLFSIGRFATRHLASAAFATSSARSVVFRTTAKPRFQSSGIYRRSPQLTRGFASVGRPKKASTLKSAESTSTEKLAKKSTRTTKAKAKPKPKPITEERKGILERRALKEAALFTEPKPLPDRPWRLFVAESSSGKADGQTAPQRMPSLAREYKELPSYEIQRLESTAAQNRLNNAAAYKAWVESHTPEEINKAMVARRSLKKKYNIPKGFSKPLHDERQPKRPATAFGLFTKARWASGEYSRHTTPMTETSRGIAREWRNLSLAERQPYADLAKSNHEGYEKAVRAVLHRDVSRHHPKQSPSP